ncbi:MAG: thioredoxin-disulfide reductase [Saprospiraceae bacterium]
MQVIQLFGADWCPDCHRAKAFLKENQVDFEFVDVDAKPEAAKLVEQINKGKRIIPTLLIDGEPYTNPDNGILRSVLGIEAIEDKTVYDSVIIGAGAAGLTTAIYAQRDGFSTLILEKKNIGGNAYLTDKIENYPGFEVISGPALMQKMADQAQKLGTIIRQGTDVRGIFKEEGRFRLETNIGEYYARTVVVATGSSYRKLGIPGEVDLIGSGVHFCATCDGAFYKNKEVVVVGGGNSALEEGMHLAGIAKKVTFINLTDQFTATSTYLDQLALHDNIEVHHNSQTIEFVSDESGLFQGAKIQDTKTGETQLIKADGAFVFVGLIPNTGFVKKTVALDERKFVITDENHQASIPGIFAAGDGRKGAIAQVAFAVGEGVAASYGIRKYLKSTVTNLATA